MKNLEQKGIGDYLLNIQVALYTAAKKILSKARNILRKSGSLADEKRNVFEFGNCLISPLNKTLTRCRQIQSSGNLVANLNLLEIDYVASEYDLLWRHYCDAYTHSPTSSG